VKRLLIISIGLILLLSACGRSGDAQAGGSRQSAQGQAVMVSRLEPMDLNEYVRVSGRLEGITDFTMSAESSGLVLGLYKKLGDQVMIGERIGQLENEILESRLASAQAALVSAEANLSIANDNYFFALAASDRGLISDAEFKAADTARAAAESAHLSAMANAQSAGTAYENSYLLAPRAGTISQLFVSEGQLVNMGSPVASITDASTLILKTGVGESQIGKLRKGQSATISHDGKSYSAKVRGFGIRPLPNSASYPVELELSGESGLIPGMVISAQIRTNTYRGIVATQVTNLVREYDKDFIFVVEEDDEGNAVASRRELVLGRSISGYREILAGVEQGELIVVSGAENLEDGSPVSIRQ